MKNLSHCHMIGLESQEIHWVRLLVELLRSPHPLVPELARQALEYVDSVAQSPDPRATLPIVTSNARNGL